MFVLTTLDKHALKFYKEQQCSFPFYKSKKTKQEVSLAERSVPHNLNPRKKLLCHFLEKYSGAEIKPRQPTVTPTLTVRFQENLKRSRSTQPEENAKPAIAAAVSQNTAGEPVKDAKAQEMVRDALAATQPTFQPADHLRHHGEPSAIPAVTAGDLMHKYK